MSTWAVCYPSATAAEATPSRSSLRHTRLLEAYGGDKIILVGSDEKELEKATGELRSWLYLFAGESIEVARRPLSTTASPPWTR